MRGYIRTWTTGRKSVVGRPVKSASPGLTLNAKLILISYRFSYEATYIISYRFLCEATGTGQSPLGKRLRDNPYRYTLFYNICSSRVKFCMASSTKKKKKLNFFLWVVEHLMDRTSYLQKIYVRMPSLLSLWTVGSSTYFRGRAMEWFIDSN